MCLFIPYFRPESFSWKVKGRNGKVLVLKYHAMEKYGEVEVQLRAFLNAAFDGGWSSHSGSFPQERASLAIG
jgi:hypothetical protein